MEPFVQNREGASTHAFDEFFKILPISQLELVCNGADLVVVPGAQNAAHRYLVRIELALGRGVQVVDVPVNVGFDHRSRVLGTLRGEHNHEVLLRLHAQVGLHVVFQRFCGVAFAAEEASVLALDGVDVGIGASQQHIVEDMFLGAHAGQGIAQQVDVVEEGSADESDEAFLQITARFLADLLQQFAPMDPAVGLFDGCDLPGILGCQDPDQRLLIRAPSLHGLHQQVGVGNAIIVNDHRRPVPRGRRGRRILLRIRVHMGWGLLPIIRLLRLLVIGLLCRLSIRLLLSIGLLRRLPIWGLLRGRILLLLLRRGVLLLLLRPGVLLLLLRRGILLLLWRRRGAVRSLLRRRVILAGRGCGAVGLLGRRGTVRLLSSRSAIGLRRRRSLLAVALGRLLIVLTLLRRRCAVLLVGGRLLVASLLRGSLCFVVSEGNPKQSIRGRTHGRMERIPGTTLREAVRQCN